MVFVIGVLIIIIIYLIARSFYIEKQVESIANQLVDINKNKVDNKITIGLLNKKIEILAKEINNVIQIKKQSESNKIKLENDLRKTIANMSHDLRTPLTSIKGYIQFLKYKDDLKDDEKKEYLNIAEERTKTLEILLNDFYELSLIDSLDFEMKLEKVNISRILQEILMEKYADFQQRKLCPKIEISNENIYILADIKSLERIIENLLSNIIKYAKDNVSIYLEAVNNIVVLKISNSTYDLNSEDAEKIFDRFYMADKTRSGKGTGLGLAIAKELVEKMDGSIEADLVENMLSIICRFKILNV